MHDRLGRPVLEQRELAEAEQGERAVGVRFAEDLPPQLVGAQIVGAGARQVALVERDVPAERQHPADRRMLRPELGRQQRRRRVDLEPRRRRLAAEAQHPGDVLPEDADVRVVRAERPLEQRLRPPQRRDRLGVPTLALEAQRQIVERQADVGVVRPASALRQRHRAGEGRLGLFIATRAQVHRAEPVDRPAQRRVLRAEQPLAQRDAAQQLRLGLREAARAEVDEPLRQQHAGLVARPLARPHQRPLGQRRPPARLLVAPEVVTDDVEQGDQAVEQRRVVATPQRLRYARRQRGDRRLVLARDHLHVTQSQLRLGLQRPVAQRRRPLHRRPRQRQRVLVLARRPQRARLRQRRPHRLDRARLLRRRRLPLAQRRRVRAAVQRRQGHPHVHRTLHHLHVRRRVQPRQRPQVLQAPGEARHPQVHQRLRLLPAQLRRLAAVAVHRQPRRAVLVDLAPRQRPRVRRVDRPAGHERPLRPRLHLRVPYADQPRRTAGAALHRRRRRLLAPDEPDDQHPRQRRRARAEQPAVAPLHAAPRDLGEQRVHAGEACVPVRRQPADTHAMQPPRHRAAGRRRRPARQVDRERERLDRVAVERALAVQRLPQRDAEAELVGARVDARARVLLRRHVRRRPDHRADARQPVVEQAVP